MSKPTVSAIAILFLLTPHLARGGDRDWPAWRGPSANGIAPVNANPPVKWDQTTNVKWKSALPGRGSASPIIWGDQVFIATSIKTDRLATDAERPKPDPRFQTRTKPPANFYQFEIISYDLATGAEKWRKRLAEAVPHEGHHETHSYAAGSPATDGKTLIVSFGSFGIYALDLAGKPLWKRDFGRINSRLGWGEAVTPVIHGSTVFLNWDQEGAGDSKLIALDLVTGQTKWEAKRDERSTWSTPLVVEHAGKTIVLMNGTNRARAYDAADGSVIWQVGGMTVNPIPSPLVDQGRAIFMSGYSGSGAVAVPLDARGDLAMSDNVAWRYTKNTPYVPSPLLVNNRLYFTKGNTQLLTILNATTGQPILSEERLPGLNQIYASPLFAAGRIYFTDRQGTTIVLKDSAGFEPLATNRLNDPIDASPAVSGRTLILRGEKFLYALEERP